MQIKPTVIVRHRRENLKKCSLRGLESREDLLFVRYPYQTLPPLHHYIVLAMEAPPLTAADAAHGLLLVDGTWRYAERMMSALMRDVPTLIVRSLPSSWQTAYPRRQDDCLDPARGLATVEALFAAYHILGRSTVGLLDHYHWKEPFLQLNSVNVFY